MNKRWIKTSVLSMVALTLSACGGQTGNPDQAAPVEEVVVQNKMPDRPFIYAAQQNVGTIDPAKALDGTEMITMLNLYDPLFAPEREDGSIAPVPHLAEEYDVSEDGKTYTVTLREGITFHSGNPLTANDVAYSMERMLGIGEGNSWLWSELLDEKNVTVQDDHTVVFKLNKPYAPFISSLTQLFVVDSNLVKENEQNNDYGENYLSKQEAGSGPYTLKKWDRETQIEFEGYEDYWKGWEEDQLKQVQMKFVTEESTVKTLLVSGQADMVHSFLNPSTYEEFKKQDGIVVQEDPSALLQEMPMNTQKAPTDDLNVRKAIASVFDYEIANEQILGGSTQAIGPVPASVEGHNENVLVFNRYVEKAKEYLEQSAYADEDLSVSFMFIGDLAEQRQYSQLISSKL